MFAKFSVLIGPADLLRLLLLLVTVRNLVPLAVVIHGLSAGQEGNDQ